MKRLITTILICLSPMSYAHESVIHDMVTHSPYLKDQQVKSYGDLRLIKYNQLNQSFPYSHIQSPTLYGIGMPKGLDKELLVASGNLYEGYFDQHHYHAQQVKAERDIAFMAYVNVKDWQTITLTNSIQTFSDLEKALPKLAERAGIDSTVPFPFILKAKVDGLKWFIVDGIGNGQPNYLSSFLRQRYLGGLEDTEIEGVGFYSAKHQGILSAPNSKMHIHFKTVNSPLFVGHIDNQMTLSKGTRILFPAKN